MTDSHTSESEKSAITVTVPTIHWEDVIDVGDMGFDFVLDELDSAKLDLREAIRLVETEERMIQELIEARKDYRGKLLEVGNTVKLLGDGEYANRMAQVVDFSEDSVTVRLCHDPFSEIKRESRSLVFITI